MKDTEINYYLICYVSRAYSGRKEAVIMSAEKILPSALGGRGRGVASLISWLMTQNGAQVAGRNRRIDGGLPHGH
ncbi:hypothetical protein PSAL_017570 [Pseudooceanicola algae]|uniref:Uncharacterized protein n=1 Tax=Pseudooceanicola algae TaxID=1537215 RepID=A0A418SHJ0_9RHOB|nr:hypothetical protein PSAL_017570 [Pseudooceanicola algae]